jgi:hypothetical protein
MYRVMDLFVGMKLPHAGYGNISHASASRRFFDIKEVSMEEVKGKNIIVLLANGM